MKVFPKNFTKNRKGNWDIVFPLILLLILFSFLLLAKASIEFRTENGYTLYDKECVEGCKSYDMDFVNYDKKDCWCRTHEGEPKQIW